MVKKYRKYSDEEVGKVIEESVSWRETAFKLGLNGNAGSNNKTLKKIAQKNNFDYSHFKGQGWNLGKTSPNAVPLKKILRKGTYYKSCNLKKRLVKEGILEDKCILCGQLPVWNNKPLVLELDHIDGDNTNNELSNLRILCGHCHSQTPTFRGRKLKEYKKEKNRQNNIKYKKVKSCTTCGIKILKGNKYNLCKNCYLEQNLNCKVKNRPSKEQLLEDIKKLGYCGTGRKYGVSDNAVRKWVN